nr:MAG TPA: hypothetical protein [Caudoviricetes sp.]
MKERKDHMSLLLLSRGVVGMCDVIILIVKQ